MAANHTEISLARLLARWGERLLLGAVALTVVCYVIDLATFYVRGKPVDQITVNKTLAVPLKGNKTEFDFEGSNVVICSRSLFPQAGNTPCWYLRRHTTQTDQL